jgi:hypothetical protein
MPCSLTAGRRLSGCKLAREDLGSNSIGDQVRQLTQLVA